MAFGVGYLDHPVHPRHSPTSLLRSGYGIAAAAGIDSYWMPDHLNSLAPRSIATPEYLGLARLFSDVDAMYEPWTALGHIAGWNRLRRLRLGIGVTDAGRRNPAVTAQAAATLHLITGGRAILGIGVGEREGNEPYGVPWDRPVARFEEALATIRALWNSRANSYRGNRSSSRSATLFSPCRPTAGSGRRSGSPPTVRECCGPPVDMPMPGTRPA